MTPVQTPSASSARSRAARRPRRLGSETPRIFTPPLRELTDETTLGFAAIHFAVHICGIDLYPWQRWLLIHALELDPALTVSTLGDRGRLDPIFRFRKIIVLVARQNGKSTLSQVLSLFFLYELGTDLVLGTAQDLDTAEEVWDGALDIIEDTPELAALADTPVKANGKKAIRLISGERYKVKAANRRAGRGLSGDLILLDELREHQSWDAWGAITKTTMARPAAMIWALSNAGDATSVVLRYLRKAAHAAIGDPDGINADDDPATLLPTESEIDHMEDLAADDVGDLDLEDFEEEDVDSLGIFEWSAKPDCSVSDRDGWAQANPSMGHGISERTLAGDSKGDPEWVFRTECLCQWSEGSLEGPFPPGSWDEGSDAESRIGAESERTWCVDVSGDRSMSYIGIAGWRDDGEPHVEVVAQRAGTSWVTEWFEDKDSRREWPVALQAKGAPVSSLLEDLQAVEGLTVVEWGGSALGAATGAFYDGVRCEPIVNKETGETRIPKRIHHRPQPVLDIAAATAAVKLLSDGAMVWNRTRSPVDVAPLVAVTGAHWLLNQRPDKPIVSAYESSGLMTV